MYQNGLITAPVSVWDVRRALGLNSTDVGTLCTSTRINIWAKYKPERIANNLAPVTDSQRKNGLASNVGKFSIIMPLCGTSAEMNEEVHDLLTNNGGRDTGWTYLKPRGLSWNEPYRITDFTDGTVNGYGYNHAATIAFETFINKSGMERKTRNDGSAYYEVNIQNVQSLVVQIVNNANGSSNLRLQDFIGDGDGVGGRYWRPIIQVYADSGTWYYASSPVKQVAGDHIYDNGSTPKVSLDLTDSVFQEGQFYHICIGIGCVNDSFSSWRSGHDSLFLTAFDQKNLPSGSWIAQDVPFYIQICPVSYTSRKIVVTQISYFNGGAASWINVQGVSGVFTITNVAYDIIGVTFTITKEDQAVWFVGQYQQAQGQSLKIQVRESINGGTEQIKYLTPADPNNSWTESNPQYVGSGTRQETVTLYGTFYKGSIPVGSYAEYHLWADTTGTGDFNEAGYFSIRMTQHS